MAPEIKLNQNISGVADVYSYGLILYALFFEEEPFTELKDITDIDEFWQRKISEEVLFPENADLKIKQFIEALTRSSPNDRPSFEDIEEQELLQDTFEFKGNDKFLSIWQEFEGRETVHLIELVLKFYQKYGYKPGQLEMVKNSLCYKCFRSVMNPNQAMVNEEGFKRFVNIFQPLEDDGVMILEKAVDLLKRKSFWGYLNSDDANLVLTKSEHGKTYIVRFSYEKGSQGKLTVSWSDQKRGKNPKHYRFYYSKLDEIEENLQNNGYKNGIKKMDELPFQQCHTMFAKQDQVLSDIPPNLSHIQGQWETYTNSVKDNDEMGTVEELFPKEEKTGTPKKRKDKKKKR